MLSEDDAIAIIERERTNERTDENVARYIHACAYYGASRDKEEKRRARIGENFFARHSQDPSQRVIYAYIRALMGGARVIQNLTSDKVGGEIRGQVQGPKKVLAAFEGKVRSITIL